MKYELLSLFISDWQNFIALQAIQHVQEQSNLVGFEHILTTTTLIFHTFHYNVIQ